MDNGPESARVAHLGDVDRLVELARDYFAQLRSARGGPEFAARLGDLPDRITLAKRVALPSSGGVIVGSFDTVVAGFALVDLPVQGGTSTAAEVRALYVEPEMRRVGVAEAMFGELVRLAQMRGATALDVPVLPGDGAMKSFLETMGFRARLLTMNRTLTP